MSHCHVTTGLAFCSVLQRKHSWTQYILDSNLVNAICSTDYISKQKQNQKPNFQNKWKHHNEFTPVVKASQQIAKEEKQISNPRNNVGSDVILHNTFMNNIWRIIGMERLWAGFLLRAMALVTICIVVSWSKPS